jgi:hypothetical protein
MGYSVIVRDIDVSQSNWCSAVFSWHSRFNITLTPHSKSGIRRTTVQYHIVRCFAYI